MSVELKNTYGMLSQIQGSNGSGVSQELRQALEMFRSILYPSRNSQVASQDPAQKPQTLMA